MASDPAIRQAMLEGLQACGGEVSGATYGEVVELLAPVGVSMTKAKVALNSLAYTNQRPRQVVIDRVSVGRTTVGDISVSLRS